MDKGILIFATGGLLVPSCLNVLSVGLLSALRNLPTRTAKL